MLRTAYCGALLVALALPLLAGCAPTPGAGPTAPASPAGTTAGAAPTAPAVRATTPPSPAPSTTAAASGAPAGTAGCDNGRTTIPAGARTVRVNDIDGDGRQDTAFFTTSKPWEFGFATAAGGVYTTPDRQTPTGRHSAWTVGTDGFPGRAIVVDDGLGAVLLTFQHCGFAPLTAKDGSALSIAIGARSAAGDATTGVACNDRNGGVLIEAAQARLRSDGRYDIAWSTLEPIGTPTGATFSAPEVRYRGLPATDVRVQQARTSICWAAHTLTATH
jgi:hypothetical protein